MENVNKQKRKGLWIPDYILNIENLDLVSKAILSEIYSLHQLQNGCTASNNHFAALVGLTRTAIVKRIDKLVDRGYINTKNIYQNNRCIGRLITPLKLNKVSSENAHHYDNISGADNHHPSDAGNSSSENTHYNSENNHQSSDIGNIGSENIHPNNTNKNTDTNTEINTNKKKENFSNLVEVESVDFDLTLNKELSNFIESNNSNKDEIENMLYSTIKKIKDKYDISMDDIFNERIPMKYLTKSNTIFFDNLHHLKASLYLAEAGI